MRGQAGFSLLETLISSLLLAVAVGGLFTFMGLSISGTQTTASLARMDQDLGRALDRVATELGQAQAATLLPQWTAPASGSQINYRKPLGYAGAIVWGPPSVIERRADPTDPDDGLDNNGNGLVDEGQLVLRTNPGAGNEEVVILLRGVPELLQGETADNADENGNGLEDESGFCVDFGDTLNIRLSLQRVGPRGLILTRTLETALVVRN